jgi:hypothetical protein
MTEALTVEELYERHVKPLPPAERLRLLAMTAQDLAREPADHSAGRKRSILELHGLGAEIWQGIDAQDYVNELRSEWDQRR